jgi:hypothetical protein
MPYVACKGLCSGEGREVCATRMREKGGLLSETRPQISQKHRASVWERVGAFTIT